MVRVCWFYHQPNQEPNALTYAPSPKTLLFKSPIDGEAYTMKNSHLRLVAYLILLAAAIFAVIQWQSKVVSDPIAPRKTQRSNGRARSGNTSDSLSDLTSAGLGQIPDVDRVEYLDTKEFYERYGLTNVFSPGPPPHGTSSFKVFFNSADEVVKIEFGQGSYKSFSRAEQIMARMKARYGFEFETVGVSGLILEDNQRMVEILKKTPFKGYYETREFEITPITFRKTDQTSHNSPLAKDLVGKSLNGFLVRQSRGPRQTLLNSDLPDYYPDEKIRWTWSFHVFPSEFSKLGNL